MRAKAIVAILLLGILVSSSIACGRGGGEAAVGKIAFVSSRDGNNDIYVIDADGSNQTNLTNNPAYAGMVPMADLVVPFCTTPDELGEEAKAEAKALAGRMTS